MKIFIIWGHCFENFRYFMVTHEWYIYFICIFVKFYGPYFEAPRSHKFYEIFELNWTVNFKMYNCAFTTAPFFSKWRSNVELNFHCSPSHEMTQRFLCFSHVKIIEQIISDQLTSILNILLKEVNILNPEIPEMFREFQCKMLQVLIFCSAKTAPTINPTQK